VVAINPSKAATSVAVVVVAAETSGSNGR
jgi:hypothetical protein